MSEKKALKHYFNSELAERLANLIWPHFSDFPQETFIKSVAEKVEPLELKDRVACIADELRSALPPDYLEALNILLNILGPENETEEGMFTNGYFLMPVAYVVEKYGLQHVQASMNALYEITKRHTSEYAIRPYLEQHPEKCLPFLHDWVYDSNPHVRRLASEGTRPRLPWAKRMQAIKGNPANNLALLEILLDDPSHYVRKSVANHVNDLTKDYRDTTLSWLYHHLNHKGNYIHWIFRHGLRSLAKSGDPEALEILEIIGAENRRITVHETK